jgi:DNA polymerase-3 subunit epsilon
MYAIVDIETTGSYAAANGITEIAIHVFDGIEVVEVFESLVNPLQPIPPFIQQMTGITNQMVAAAPPFTTIAERVYNILQGQIFVAHNVQFDYSFVKAQLKAAGFELNCSKLCTVRLSRQILPGYPSYSLGKLCRSLGISLENRHRAGGDTAATVALFKKLLHEDKSNHIAKSLKRNSKEWILPPHVPRSDFDRLPTRPGVYYFHDKKDKVVYVGKAINIRYRVNSHFSNDAPTAQKQKFIRTIHRITYQECATPLMATLLESAEIKHRWPRFNAAQKKREEVFSLFVFEDQHGYQRIAVDRLKKNVPSLLEFYNIAEGQALIRKMARTHGLCLRLCFLQDAAGACTGEFAATCKGACTRKETAAHYNKRVKLAVEELVANGSFLILDKGRNSKEMSCILVEKGSFYGMGYVPATDTIQDNPSLKSLLTPYRNNSTIQKTIRVFKDSFPDKIIPL